ncbi:MAG: hypothetical protein EZS28_014754 [Streblomastix strix]|uniref:RRM domain-containing protein n=1 Tax=Streblomastix strix TaxID=222440 RepID=A0A5J4W4R1_9EUKA|nr:MAG: hypothetical protein EZS28_014754 [Streblomastix strix]
MTQFGVLVSWEGSNIEQEILMKLFEPYQAVDVTIDQVRPDNNNRTAFVRFMTQQAAEQAQEQIEGLVVGENVLQATFKKGSLQVQEQLTTQQTPVLQSQRYVIPSHVSTSTQNSVLKPKRTISPPQEVYNKGLYITNIDQRTTERDLLQIFSRYNVCSIPPKQNSCFVHYGFADFVNEEDACLAFQRSDGMNPVDKRILFVRNINPLTTEENFRNAFAPFKAIKCDIGQNQRPNEANIGWADFSNENDASRALEHFNNKIIEEYQWKVQFKKLPMSSLRNELFINYLSPQTTQETLNDVFLVFNPTSIQIFQKQTLGRSKYAIVKFLKDEDGQNAMKSLQGKEIDEAKIKISFKDDKDGQNLNFKENESKQDSEQIGSGKVAQKFSDIELQEIQQLIDLTGMENEPAICLYLDQGKDIDRAIDSICFNDN